MGAVDDDTYSVEPQPARKALLDELDVAAAGVLKALDPAELGRDGAPARPLFERCLDLQLDLVRQLVPVAAEELDAVVRIGVVRGRKHDAEIGAQAARQHGDGRGRERADQHDIHAHRDKPGGQRRLEHVAGQPRILADDDQMLVRAVVKAFANGHRHFQCRLRRHRFAIGGPADPVGTKQLPRHRSSPTGWVARADQAPGCGCGSGSRPLGRPEGGTELRLPGRTSSVAGPADDPRTIRSPLMTRRISSADSVSYSSSPLASACNSSSRAVKISRAACSPSSTMRRISSSITLAVASETFLRWVTEWPRKTSSSFSL